MLRLTLTLLVTVFTGQLVMAQSVEDGKKLIYYERFLSAKESLQKTVAAKPGDAQAVYWLGQAYLGLKDIAGAKEVYRKGLEIKGSEPILLVGMGEVELKEGKTNEARQRFETAISLSKGKDIDILNAVGRANVNSKNGDAAYALEKLTMATKLKGFRDPDVYINMGDAYRMLQNGGGAVSSYQNALSIDPKYAEASYRIGKVYLTQGAEQADLIKKYYTDAITNDPKYAPALYDFYVFYFFRDVNKAREYFDMYKNNTDKTPALDYEEASLSFAASDFQGAIQKADALLQTQGANADARLYRLKGYSYNKLGDSAKAAQNLQTFFEKATEDQVIGDNYLVLALSLASQPGKQEQAEKYMLRAIETDTSVKNKVDYAKKMADFYKASGNQGKVAEWITRVLSITPMPGKVDIYNAGFENFKAGEYMRADSIFKIYSTQYPNEVYGHYWSFRSLSVVDSTMEQGLAIPDCQKFIEVAEQDKDKNKNTLITAYGYMAGYNANIKKDYPTAINFLDKILELDPSNADAAKNKDILIKATNGKGASSYEREFARKREATT